MPADEKIALVVDATGTAKEIPISFELNKSLDLIDIESPVEPGFDWTPLIDSMLWIVVLLLFLTVLLKFGKRFYQPAALRWQLNRLIKKCQNSEEKSDVIEFEQAWLLYGWCLNLQKITKTAPPEMNGRHPSSRSEFESLLVKVNQLSFSKQPVSRETYLELLHEAEAVLPMVSKANSLKASNGWFSFKNRLMAMLKTLTAGNS